MQKYIHRKNINVSVNQTGPLIKIESDEDVIGALINSPVPPNLLRFDFAVWFFLPVAMRCNADLTIMKTNLLQIPCVFTRVG
jgi:hypothetical protein